MFKTPILFLIFNRLETTQQVFPQIKKIKPAQLFIAADGPRNDVEGEKEKCEAVRNWVLSEVDWDCELQTLFRPKNLGCKYAVSSAINWFFENVEEGIILEDDCLPHESFFNFCEVLLDRYRHVEKVMHISGNNFQDGITRGDGTYYFSQFPHIWGWATWKRAWSFYDIGLKNYPRFEKKNKIVNIVTDEGQARFWLKNFQAGFDNSIDTWDYAWFFSFISNDGYAILPNKNLVSNIGFGENATHTTVHDVKVENLPSFLLTNIIHPSFLTKDVFADDYTFKKLYTNYHAEGGSTFTSKNFLKILYKKFKLTIKNILKKIAVVAGYEFQISKIRAPVHDKLEIIKGNFSLSYPPSHPLAKILNDFPKYSQNIGKISKIIKTKYNDLHIIDIGANIGDTVMFIRNETDCAILSIEGDKEYFEYLVSNTKGIENIFLFNSFVGESDNSDNVIIDKLNGTAKVFSEASGKNVEFLTLDTILNGYESFKLSKLLKIDTDGYDIKILNGSVDFIKQTKPVIFFEYDVNFYSSAEILTVCLKSLEDLGYSQIVAYDNFGNFFLKINIRDYLLLGQLTRYIKNSTTIYYFDFCVFHEEDSELANGLCKFETINL